MASHCKKWDIQQKQSTKNMLKDDRYGKTLMNTATKTGIDAAKTASKRLVQKTSEATGDLVGNKIADKIISVGKTKSKVEERQETQIPPEKDSKLLMTYIKMEYQKITNLLDATLDKCA